MRHISLGLLCWDFCQIFQNGKKKKKFEEIYVSMCSVPGFSVTNTASDACNDNNRLNDSEVFLFAICSSHLPSETKVNNIGGVSKNVLGLFPGFSINATSNTIT